MAQAQTVVPIHRGRMSEADYETERARLRDLYGDGSTAELVAKRDQALAALFYRSGWTQEELAKKEQKDRGHIARRLLFGRFLAFVPMDTNSDLPRNLTERHFRSHWEQTDAVETNERIRFQAVIKLMEGNTALMAPRRKLIGKAIRAKFADGKWHKLDTIVAGVGFDRDHVKTTLDAMEDCKTYGVVCDRKQVAKDWQYRLFYSETKISTTELIEKLGPIIKALIEQGEKDMATMSTATVKYLALKLERQLEDWTSQ